MTVFFVSFLDWNEDVALPHYAYLARSIFNVPAVQEEVEELLENKECKECEELLNERNREAAKPGYQCGGKERDTQEQSK